MFDKATQDAVKKIAARIKVEPAAMLAVAEVESNGVAFALVDGQPQPLIRWEGHYFDRRLKGAERELARAKKLASPKAGGIPNPANQAKRWNIVERAAQINRQAAMESFSIGVGQVMTSHWEKLGFDSVDEMIKLARRDVAGQIDLMARFIEQFGLADELQRLDFTAFARGYNGAGFRKNAYHTKMAKAYRRYSGDFPVSKAKGMLRMGAKGAGVRQLQRLLERAGYAVKVDGDFGASTRDAVRAFQRGHNVEVDGVAGPETLRLLEEFQLPDDKPGMMAIADVDEVKAAAPVAGGVALLAQFRDQITDAASYLTGTGSDSASSLGEYLLAGAGFVGLMLAAWAIYGWWRSRQTDEGDIEVM